MRKSCTRPMIVILCTLFLRVSARICSSTTSGYGIIVYSQSDADTKLQGCDTLASNLIIAHSYTGELVLHGIKNITQGFMTSPGNGWAAPGDKEEGVPGLTSIVANDLLEIGPYGLYLQNSSSLLSARFDKLQKASEILIELDTVGGSIDFPALETVTESLFISGDFSSMKFPRLARVGGYMSVVNRPELRAVSTFSLDLGKNPPLAIDFPSLVECSSLTIAGNISEISMPALVTVGDFAGRQRYSSSYSTGRVQIYTQGAPLILTLLSLWNVSTVSLAGTFANFSFPALHHLEDRFQFQSQTPISINIAPLESANSIYLSGNLTGYNISSLRAVYQSLGIGNDNNSLDCNPGRQKWLQLHPDYSVYKNDDYIPGFNCYQIKKKPFPKLKVGLGVGLGVPGFLLFVFAAWRHVKNIEREDRLKKDPLPDYETEMQTRSTGGGEILPEYEPPDDHESTRRASVVNSLSDMARPTEGPPAYDASNSRGAVTTVETEMETGSGRRETAT